MIKTSTITKYTIIVQKDRAIEQYNDATLDHIRNGLTASEYEYCEDLINLGQELKRMHDNKFRQFFKDGATMLLLESDDFQLLEEGGHIDDFFFEIVVMEGDKVVETISSDDVTW